MNRFPRKSYDVRCTAHNNALPVGHSINTTHHKQCFSQLPSNSAPTDDDYSTANQQRWRLVYNFPIRYAACNLQRGKRMEMHHQAAGDLALHCTAAGAFVDKQKPPDAAASFV